MIPEMQILTQKPEISRKSNYSWRFTPVDLTSDNLDLNGRFIVLDILGNKHIYAANDHYQSLSHKDLEQGYNQFLEQNGLNNTKEYIAQALNGGFFDLNSRGLRLYGESEYFGKYDKEIVRPIVERFTLEHLKGIEAKLE